MATINSTLFLTLADWASRMEDKKVATIVELLAQSNPVLDDLIFRPANSATGHKTTVRTGLPEVYWRKINQGVPSSKSTTAQIVDTAGMLEAYSYVDKALASLEDDQAAFRLSEDVAFVQSMSLEMASNIFYGNEKEAYEKFTGLSPRYNTTDPAKAASAANVIDAGGTGNSNTSIWLCNWSPQTGFGFFPKGSKAGVQVEDVTTDAPVKDADGHNYQAYGTHYKWDAGLSIRDWRYFARIANIDVTKLQGNGSFSLVNALIALLNLPPTMPTSAGHVQGLNTGEGRNTSLSSILFGNPVLYMNRTVATALDIQMINKNNVFLTTDTFEGKVIRRFRGIEIKVCDAIRNDEACVK